MDELPSHLGGHKNKTHLDEGTIDYLIKKFKPKSFLDIGCGPGGMVKIATNKGLKARGIDGDWLVERDKSLQQQKSQFEAPKFPLAEYKIYAKTSTGLARERVT